MHDSLSSDEQREIKAQIARHIRAEYAANRMIPDPQAARWLDYLEHRIGRASDPIWSGYALNTLTAALVFLALRALCVNGASLSRHMEARRYAARCGCAHCGYDLTGLTTSICPECGRRQKQNAPSVTEGDQR